MEKAKIQELRKIVEDFKANCHSQFPEHSTNPATIDDVNELSRQVYYVLDKVIETLENS